MVICTAKAEKSDRTPRSTKPRPETKSPAEVWGDAAERGCVISLGYCISLTVPKTHGASFEVWFGFTSDGAFKF